MLLKDSNIQSNTNVLPVAKWLIEMRQEQEKIVNKYPLDTLKRHLDSVLRTLPDHPRLPGYMQNHGI